MLLGNGSVARASSLSCKTTSSHIRFTSRIQTAFSLSSLPMTLDSLDRARATSLLSVAQVPILLRRSQRCLAHQLVDVLHPDHANPVDGPASANNPGESAGARAQERLTGTGTCGL